MIANSQNAYGSLAKLFHWLTFLLLIGAFSLGFLVVEMKEEAMQDPDGPGLSPQILQMFSYHKWIGVTIFLLAILRLGWRLISPPPPMLATIPRAQQMLAHAVHGGIYLLLFAIPIIGWIASSAKGFKTVYLGIITLPDLVKRNRDLGESLAEVHELLGFALLALFALHVAGALKHHFIDRDTTLKRMLPFSKSSEPTA
jgi:cytochrome b561